VATCLWLGRQSMQVKIIGAARTLSAMVAVLPWAHAQGERRRGSGVGTGVGGEAELCAQLVGPCHVAPSRACVTRPDLCERRMWHGA